MKLYSLPASGNALKVRLLLSLLGISYEQIVPDVAAKQLESQEFRRINPRGQIPVLESEGRAYWDSSACLVYLARRYGGETWFPTAPEDMAEVVQWLALAGNEIQFGLQYARREVRQGRSATDRHAYFQETGRIALTALEARLSDHDWVALNRPTIGDIACFPYVDLAPEGAIPLDPYPGVIKWLARCKALPGWLSK
jgi:glutathione S-transferase